MDSSRSCRHLESKLSLHGIMGDFHLGLLSHKIFSQSENKKPKQQKLDSILQAKFRGEGNKAIFLKDYFEGSLKLFQFISFSYFPAFSAHYKITLTTWFLPLTAAIFPLWTSL